MPARLTGKRTETRHKLRDLENEMATLAKATPQHWEQIGRHLHAVGRLAQATYDLARHAAHLDKEAAWALHAQIGRTFHGTYESATRPLSDAMAQLKHGDTSRLEMILAYLEADPYFYGSGYFKEQILPIVCRLSPHAESTAVRLRQIVLNRVQSFWGREFPFYKRLAYAVDSTALRAALDKLVRSKDIETRVRASAVLRYLSDRSGQ